MSKKSVILLLICGTAVFGCWEAWKRHALLSLPGSSAESVARPLLSGSLSRTALRTITVSPSLTPLLKIPTVPEKEPRPPSVARPPPGFPYLDKPNGNVIAFRVVDGLAISYGDIIMGQVEPGVPGDHGSVDAPTPRMWDKSEIPYLISPDLANSDRVEKALEYMKQRSGLRFVPYRNQPDAIAFESGSEHCYSLLGRVGGLQPIRLAEGCQVQQILHEIMHALGFIHQQSRQDRDQYVGVLWPNIDPKFWSQYSIVPESFMEGERGFAFDYNSIMLYQPNAFATRPDALTMKTKGTEPIAPTLEGFSEGDIQRINQLFKLE